jgi:hypothetical protein
MSLSVDDAMRRIDEIFATYLDDPGIYTSILTDDRNGKLYEAWVLGVVLEKLKNVELCRVTLINGPKVRLKTGGGGINRSYPHFLVQRADGTEFEVWTDVEFYTLSHSRRSPAALSRADFHELDIVVVPKGTDGRPRHTDILIGIECKHTAFQKVMVRAALGVRRELSYLDNRSQTSFFKWPLASVPARPNSILMVFSSDARIEQYRPTGEVFGIEFVHEEM